MSRMLNFAHSHAEDEQQVSVDLTAEPPSAFPGYDFTSCAGRTSHHGANSYVNQQSLLGRRQREVYSNIMDNSGHTLVSGLYVGGPGHRRGKLGAIADPHGVGVRATTLQAAKKKKREASVAAGMHVNKAVAVITVCNNK